mgnify:CR=1 FL=1
MPEQIKPVMMYLVMDFVHKKMQANKKRKAEGRAGFYYGHSAQGEDRAVYRKDTSAHPARGRAAGL